MNKTLLLGLLGSLLTAFTAPAETAAQKMGWTLAVHSYTFQKFSIFDAIEKTASIGVSHMSISGSINLPGTDGQIAKSPTIDLPEPELAAVTAVMKSKGLDPSL